MATKTVNLPQGFVLDDNNQTQQTKKPKNLPKGFVLDQQPLIADKYQPQDLAKKPLFQAAKGLYEGFQAIPGGKTYSKLLGKAFPEDKGGYSRQDIRDLTPEPKGFIPTATRVTARILPEAVAMAPMVEGAMGAKVLQQIPKLSRMSLGFGAYEGAKPLVDPEKTITEKVEEVPSEFSKGAGLSYGFGKGLQLAGKGLKYGGEGIVASIKKATGKLSEMDINRHIDTAISKAVRPSVKATQNLMNKYKENSRQAVKTIIENKRVLQLKNAFGEISNKLPETLDEFSQSIDQVKKSIFEQYDKIARTAGKQRLKVNLKPIADSIEREINNKSIRTMYPEVVKNALDLSNRLRKSKYFTPKQAQQAIEMLNNNLKAFYRNPNPQGATSAVVDASIATKIRNSLDSVVKTIDKSYTPLKRQFGALRSMQDDVTKRAVVDARKNIKGFFDLSDVFSTGDIVKGLIKMNPADIAKGTAQKGILAYFKNLNNPNRIIKDMFSTVERSYKPTIGIAKKGIKKVYE